jgi:hypothetical protein
MIKQLKKSHLILKNDETKIKKIAIGLLLLLFSWLIIPMILYQGYMMRILRETKNEEMKKLPSWNDPVELLFYGFISIVFIVTVNVPGTVMSIIPLFIESAVIELLFVSVSSLISLISTYILFCLLVVGMRDGLSEIFNIDRIFNILTSEEYIINQILTIAIGSIFAIISIILSLTIIGIPVIIILIPVFAFYVNLIMGLAVTAADEDE